MVALNYGRAVHADYEDEEVQLTHAESNATFKKIRFQSCRTISEIEVAE